MKRRKFIRNSLLATGAATMGSFSYPVKANTTKKFANDRIMLGNGKVSVSRLAIGTGTNGWGGRSDQTREMGIKGLSDLLRAAYDKGVFFWDSADQYGTHPHMKEALKYVPREKVTILTKTHATTEEEMKKDLDRFRKEIGTDYIDILLLHNMQSPNWPTEKRGAMDVISQAQEEGIVKLHGVSCHMLDALKAAANSDWVQIDLARINPYGARMDGTVEEVVPVLKKMKDSGKSLIGMKIFGGGKLSGHVDECLQSALSREYIDCFTIGIESLAQFNDLMTRIPGASQPA